jgi:hypothetical protein
MSRAAWKPQIPFGFMIHRGDIIASRQLDQISPRLLMVVGLSYFGQVTTFHRLTFSARLLRFMYVCTYTLPPKFLTSSANKPSAFVFRPISSCYHESRTCPASRDHRCNPPTPLRPDDPAVAIWITEQPYLFTLHHKDPKILALLLFCHRSHTTRLNMILRLHLATTTVCIGSEGVD